VLQCPGNPSAHPLALFRDYGLEPLAILDVSNPLKPSVACTLSPANGGRFLSATKIAFWAGDKLGTADLARRTVTQTAQLPVVATTGAFSADGSEFAYRAYDDAGAMKVHLLMGGSDRILYSQDPIGGHGGPGPDFGPFDKLQFSADGKELLDYMLFRPYPGPPNLRIFKMDGSILFEDSLIGQGVWSQTGSVLYIRAPDRTETSVTVDSIDATGQRRTVASGLKGYFWAELAPDGQSIVYNAQDSSVPDCGGLPHVWRLDLKTGGISQLSTSVSAIPVFVGPAVLWSGEEKQSPCGPGGPSTSDGVTLAHDLSTGRDSPVNTLLLNDVHAPGPWYMSTSLVMEVRF